MPSISYDAFAAWSNYHLTIGPELSVGDGRTVPPVFPSITVGELARFCAADLGTASGLERFAATGATLMAYLRHQQKRLAERETEGQPTDGYALGVVGRGWSFAELIGTREAQLLADGLAGVSRALAGDIHPDCPDPPERVAFALGGTRLREIANWAALFGLALATSGTHLGMTIAGGAGTASHGSRLGFGGIQDMIVGLHLVTGENRQVWLEPDDAPVLSDTGLARLGSDVNAVRDRGMFDDALVHLGGMGIVNGVALRLVPDDHYAVLAADTPIDAAWLRTIEAGEFAALAAKLGCDRAPIFYELTVDPFAPFGESALHTMYFPSRAGGSSAAPRTTAADALAGYANKLALSGLERFTAALAAKASTFIEGEPDPVTAEVIQRVMKQDSAYRAYREQAKFPPPRPPRPVGAPPSFDPDHPGAGLRGAWRDLHGDQITGGVPGALYNASYAIPRERVEQAVTAICAAVAELMPVFVFTVRFVSGARGTLAFTRFAECAVIEIDGISPAGWELAKARLIGQAPPVIEALERLKPVLEQGAMAVRAALDREAIPYSMHWAKLGNLDRAKVSADFGEPEGAIARWRRTRAALLTPFAQRVFRNSALAAYGLLEP